LEIQTEDDRTDHHAKKVLGQKKAQISNGKADIHGDGKAKEFIRSNK